MGTNEIGSYYDFLSANSTFYEGTSLRIVLMGPNHIIGAVAWKYKNQYSGHVFFERANELIREHAAKLGDEPQPLLLYVAAQNVHAPLDSLPDDWFTGEERASLSNVVGNARLEYAKSLIVLDKLVNGLVDTLRKTGLADNTYLIFRCLHTRINLRS
jgi:arylsulfatase A-like enzyme